MISRPDGSSSALLRPLQRDSIAPFRSTKPAVLEKPWPSLFVGISSSIGATTGPSTTLLGLPREMVLLIAEHLDVPLQEHNKFCS